MTDQEWLNNWEKDVIRSDTLLRDFMGFATMCGRNPTDGMRKHLSKKKTDIPAPNRKTGILALTIIISIILAGTIISIWEYKKH